MAVGNFEGFNVKQPRVFDLYPSKMWWRQMDEHSIAKMKLCRVEEDAGVISLQQHVKKSNIAIFSNQNTLIDLAFGIPKKTGCLNQGWYSFTLSK